MASAAASANPSRRATVAPPEAAAMPVDPFRRRVLMSLVILCTVMQVLDRTIANVALPHMQGALGASPDTITWVLTSYIVAAAVATPVTGWLQDRFGRRAPHHHGRELHPGVDDDRLYRRFLADVLDGDLRVAAGTAAQGTGRGTRTWRGGGCACRWMKPL